MSRTSKQATQTALIGLLVVSLVIVLPADARPTSPGRSNVNDFSPLSATPLASAVAQPDPLDGDPLDGDPARIRPQPPAHTQQLAIQRSGRSKQASSSLPAYDDDPNTYWTPSEESGRAWVWLDLGSKRQLRWLSVLTRGSGTVGIELSSDLSEWQRETQFDAGGGWHGLEIQGDARYVRLNLEGVAGDAAPAVGEVDVYGADSAGSVALEQDAARKTHHKRHRSARGVVESQQAATDGSADNSGKKNKGGGNSGSDNIQVSAKKGKTDCRGKHARCNAKEGKVKVDTECPGNGNCTINVQADGGSATCDTTAGDKNKAGSGEGKHEGNGGRCEAVANGGEVTIGDINP